MTEEQLSPQESLQLIRSMINKTKENISNNAIYYLVWGWITFIACVSQFMLKHVLEYPRHYMVWWIILIGVGFSFYQGRREHRKKVARTYVGDSIRALWIGMGLAFFVLSMILTRIGWDKPIFPFFILLYGLGTFVSGSIIQFRPLVAGGLLALVLAVGCSFVTYDYQMLFGAAAILVSYIIPAYILRARKLSA
jgi:hypothetical protein